MECDVCETIEGLGWINSNDLSHCRDCHKVWPRRSERQHCTTCHETFKSINAAEKHWTENGHIHPVQLQLILRYDFDAEYWTVRLSEAQMQQLEELRKSSERS